MSSPAILSEEAVAILAKMPYQADAESAVNILPFGSIYWIDEMPSLTELLNRPQDMMVIHQMFGMRLKIWDGAILDACEQELWDAVKAQVPHWALFHRLSLTDQQRLAREAAEKQVEQEFESLSTDTTR